MRALIASPRRPAPTSNSGTAGPFIAGLALAACLIPAPAEAAAASQRVLPSRGQLHAPATCPPRWPYVLHTCVA